MISERDVDSDERAAEADASMGVIWDTRRATDEGIRLCTEGMEFDGWCGTTSGLSGPLPLGTIEHFFASDVVFIRKNAKHVGACCRVGTKALSACATQNDWAAIFRSMQLAMHDMKDLSRQFSRHEICNAERLSCHFSQQVRGMRAEYVLD